MWGLNVKGHRNFFRWGSLIKLDCADSYTAKFTKTIHLKTDVIVWKLYFNKTIDKKENGKI